MSATPATDVIPEIEPVADAEVRAIFEHAVERYIAARHERVTAFVDRHFGLIGALRLHRHALGLDLLRAPANVLLMVPYLSMQLGGAALRRLGARRAARRLSSRTPFLDTDVARELTWRLHTELLELPYDDGRRRSDKDALAAEMMADARVAAAVDRLAALAKRHAHDSDRQARLRHLLESLRQHARGRGRSGQQRPAGERGYGGLSEAHGGHAHARPRSRGGARPAGRDRELPARREPGRHLVRSVPGDGLGRAWSPARPAASCCSRRPPPAFAGVVSDPVQRAVGLHQRRLHRLIDALGRELKGDSDAAFHVRDHYVARIFDLIDLARATYRAI